MTFRTRFAPSPTGPLHLGHAYSAILAHDQARAESGLFHLRMDDIDQSRARPHWAQQIEDDLAWLGLTWDGPVWSQHARSARYQKALNKLWELGLLYACTCSRADIKAASNAPQEGAPLLGPDGIIYPGTCRRTPVGEMPHGVALRVNMRKSVQLSELKEFKFIEGGAIHTLSAENMCSNIGDVVMARKDMAASYHLSIVVDDAEQKITHIIRGEDLREATFIHVLLQKILGYATPIYNHHRLIRDESGRRLAKRDDARAIAKYRREGASPSEIRRLVGL